jgi:hypothetical protein
MPWTWDEISRLWLRDGPALEPPPAGWIDQFNIVERYFGREWMDQSRFQGGVESWGVGPTAYTASQGMRLASLDGLAGTAALIEKLRQCDPAAWAELTAIWLLRHDDPAVGVEVEPSLAGWSRVPDFRVRRGDDPWTNVEVAQPNLSTEHRRLDGIMESLSGLLDMVPGRYSLEVFLDRAPSDEEIDYLKERIPEFCRLVGPHVEQLPLGLGTLYLNETVPGLGVIQDHGKPYRPRLGRMRSRVENNAPERHIFVRLAYSDDRADAFLRSEARQLPRNAPGLIMIQTSGATGAFRQWAPLLTARLQPNQHTRVSAICLFQSGMAPSPTGLEEWQPEARAIVNPHAPLPIPQWIVINVDRHPPRY